MKDRQSYYVDDEGNLQCQDEEARQPRKRRKKLYPALIGMLLAAVLTVGGLVLLANTDVGDSAYRPVAAGDVTMVAAPVSAEIAAGPLEVTAVLDDVDAEALGQALWEDFIGNPDLETTSADANPFGGEDPEGKPKRTAKPLTMRATRRNRRKRPPTKARRIPARKPKRQRTPAKKAKRP